MGGVVDSGGGVGVKTSLCRAAIDKAQAELWQEYDIREERRRELEFLEKGGNPLDFRFGNTTTHSVQSTSLTGQQAEHFVNSEAKGSFALSASPWGDSVESSGRPGAPTAFEPSTADNLLLIDGENESLEGEGNCRRISKRNRIAKSERSFQSNANLIAKETEDSAIFRPYARRNRSRINRDPARSNSVDGHGTYLPMCGGSRDRKGSISEKASQKDRCVPCISRPNSAILTGNMILKTLTSNNQLNIELDDVPAARETNYATKALPSKDDPGVTDTKNSGDMACGEPDFAGVNDQTLSTSATPKAGQETSSSQLSGVEDSKGDKKGFTKNAKTSNLGLDVDNETDLCNLDTVNSNGIAMQKTSMVEGEPNLTGGEMVIKENDSKVYDSGRSININTTVLCEKHTKVIKDEIQRQRSTSELQNEVKLAFDMEKLPQNESSAPETGAVLASKPRATECISAHEGATLSGTDVASLKPQLDLDGDLSLTDTARKDSILEEAWLIQAKRKRIAELSFSTMPLEIRQKSQWDFVLEEMAWLANDFAQERLWKLSTAAQICRQAAFTSRLRFKKRFQHGKIKRLAFTLADAVMQFWRSMEVLGEGEETSVIRNNGRNDLVDGNRAAENKEISKEFKSENPEKSTKLGIRDYARRFLKYNSSFVPCLQAAAPSTPDFMSDSGIMETSWDDHLTEKSLFYSIPPGALEVYRKSIENHLVQCEKPGSSTQEEVETSMYNAGTDFGYNDIGYDEDEGERSIYYFPGAFKVPIKRRMRTASRQRVSSPFGPETAGSLRVPTKTDASSEDTSSFQDDLSSLQVGSVFQKGAEVESGGYFEKQLAYDCDETSVKPKKKKARLGLSYDQSWHVDSTVHNEERNPWKKRPKGHHFVCNGLYGQHSTKKQKTTKQSLNTNFDSTKPITGSILSPSASQMSTMSNPNKFIKFIGGRDNGKKTEILKISTDQQGSGNPWSLFEDQALVVLVHDVGPDWELISDAMNSTLKIMYIYRNPNECKERHRILMDRSAGDGVDSTDDSGTSQSYPSTLPGIPKGSARQLFQRLQEPMEEELIKYHFQKIIMIGKKLHYRKTQNNIRDKKQILPVHNSHVMALSQVFPNNLNGGFLTPVDLSDAITSGQDGLSLENPGSHPGIPLLIQAAAASVLPTFGSNPSIAGFSAMALHNNLPSPSVPPNASVRDVRLNIPGASLAMDEQHRVEQHNKVLSNSNIQQSSLPSPGTVSGPDRGIRTVPGGNVSQGGTNRSAPFSRPGFQVISSSRMPNSDNKLSSGTVGMPNPASLHSGIGPVQGNSMLRPLGAMHMMQLQAAHGNSQRIPPFNRLNSGFTNQATPPVHTYSGHLPQQHPIASQQSHLLSNSHHHTYLQSPCHASRAQQQAYAIGQRQMHQHYVQQRQQQQQFAASGTLLPHVPPQPQVLPQNSSEQSLISSQSLSMPPVTSTSPTIPMAQQMLLKPQLSPHGPGQIPLAGATGPANQVGKQWQRRMNQQFQQSGRQHPQQRQPTQAQQHNKFLKGTQNMVHQNLSVDQSHLNGLLVSPGIQTAEKGPVMQQGQGPDSGTSMSALQSSKPGIPAQSSNHSQPHQKVVASASPSSHQFQQMPLHSDDNIQDQVSPLPSANHLSTTQQPVVSPTSMPPSPQHLQPPHPQPH